MSRCNLSTTSCCWGREATLLLSGKRAFPRVTCAHCHVAPLLGLISFHLLLDTYFCTQLSIKRSLSLKKRKKLQTTTLRPSVTTAGLCTGTLLRTSPIASHTVCNPSQGSRRAAVEQLERGWAEWRLGLRLRRHLTCVAYSVEMEVYSIINERHET